MSHAQEITGLDCEANILDWADKVLRIRFKEILEKREAALDREAIEGVHDLRVATRRLRGDLRDFAFLIKKEAAQKTHQRLKATYRRARPGPRSGCSAHPAREVNEKAQS